MNLMTRKLEASSFIRLENSSAGAMILRTCEASKIPLKGSGVSQDSALGSGLTELVSLRVSISSTTFTLRDENSGNILKIEHDDWGYLPFDDKGTYKPFSIRQDRG